MHLAFTSAAATPADAPFAAPSPPELALAAEDGPPALISATNLRTAACMTCSVMTLLFALLLYNALPIGHM